jgi:phosphohistidine phosphatase
MKTLLILRHGKAQPDAPHGDKARVLTGRGRRDSVTMGRRVASLVERLDSILTSDARRAQETATIAAGSAGYSGEITVEPDMYGASADELLEIVQAIPDRLACVLIVGHNPSFEELTDLLAGGDAEPADLPTCGLAHLEFDAARWGDVAAGGGRLRGIYTPKEEPGG